jgi:1,4-dihydroxy-2-naphthoate octaprenyltransferase
MNPWLLAARPKTLSAAVVPVLVGTFSAPSPWHWPSFALALVASVLIQIATNLINDALDFEKGADTGERLGPVRVTQAGLLAPETVKWGALVCLILAVLCGVPLILRGGWPILAIGVFSILGAYAYTGGPWPLAYRGLGEVFVILFFGIVAVCGSFYLQTLVFRFEALAMGVAVGCLAAALLAINNLRDLPTDRASNKRTLAVRFGARFARMEIVAFEILPFVILVAVAAAASQWMLLIVLVAATLAVRVILCVFRSEGTALNGCLALSGALQWAFGILYVIGAVA